jgi:Family of unknown function (DUF6526)
MPENTPQTNTNYTRLDPPYHFFALPVALISVLVAIWNAVQHFDFMSAWLVVVSVAAVVIAFKARLYPLKAQDRIIRLEERLRFASLLPDALCSRTGELSEGQLIALRFACDAELPGLVEKTISGKLSSPEIKKAIVNWRADYFRV